MAALSLACSIPQRVGRPSLVPARWIAGAVGALCGVAWAAALRAFMWEVAGHDAGVKWAGTFLWVLLPGAAIGALLAWAEHRRWTGPVPHRRWLVWSPMLFAAVLLQNPLDLADGVEGGTALNAAGAAPDGPRAPPPDSAHRAGRRAHEGGVTRGDVRHVLAGRVPPRRSVNASKERL